MDLRKSYRADVEGDGPLMALCPIHGDNNPSLALYPNGAHCFGCGVNLKPEEVLQAYPPGKLEIRYQSRSRSSGSRPVYLPESLVETYHRWIFTRYAHRREWYHQRGLTDDTVVRFRLGHALQAFTIPVYDIMGRLKQLRYRRDDVYFDTEDGPKYWGVGGLNDPIIYQPQVLLAGRSPVYLCEGELDALRLLQEGLPAVSITNGSKAFAPEMATAFRRVERVYVCYDQDEAGRQGGWSVVRALGSKATLVRWEPGMGKDVTDLLKKVTLEEFQDIVKRSDQWRMS